MSRLRKSKNKKKAKVKAGLKKTAQNLEIPGDEGKLGKEDLSSSCSDSTIDPKDKLFPKKEMANNADFETTLISIFLMYDLDGSGFLEEDELKFLLVDTFQKFGIRREVTNHEVKSLLKEGDEDGDGKISFDELVHYLPIFLGKHGVNIMSKGKRGSLGDFIGVLK
jgi:hypothetical protein